MKINVGDLAGFKAEVAPAPPPVEPRLTPEEEARLIADERRDDPVTHARRERVRALIRRPATPEGADAELIVLLAAAKALPLEGDKDRLRARTRLAEIGRLTSPPPAVADVIRRLRLDPGDSEAFADKLLPARRDGTSQFSDNGTAGIGGFAGS